MYEDYDIEPCVYCGMPGESKDHVIPRSYSAMMYDVNVDRKKLLATFGETVPCCLQCNSLLGAMALLTVSERKKYIKSALKKKYHKVLNAPDWDDDEIESLRGLLKEHVKQRKDLKELIRARLRW